MDKLPSCVRDRLNPALDKIGDLRKQIDDYLASPSAKAAFKGYPGIKTTPNGGPDFSGTPYLYKPKPGEKNIVEIDYKGGRRDDFKAANEKAGIPGTDAPEGYTWHHVDEYNPKTGKGTMQLVRSDAHEAT